MAQTTRTIDHAEIRDWAESRGGSPAVLAGTHDGELSGILRIDFGGGNETLADITWEEFFRVFDGNDLAFVYEDITDDGTESLACKFVPRTEADGTTEDGIDGLGDVSGY